MGTEANQSVDAERLARDQGEHRAQRHLAAIVEASGDAIISLTTDGVIQTWNESAERLYGFNAEEAVGQHAPTLLARDPAERDAMLARLVAGSGPVQTDAQELRKDGTLVDVSVTDSPIHGANGQVIGIARVVSDVTSRVHAQMAARRAKAEVAAARDDVSGSPPVRSALLASMSHEIGTPLNGVIGVADLLLDVGIRASEQAPEEAEAGAQSSPSILLAEDNEVNQVLVIRMLERRGYIVEAVGDGRQALLALKAGGYSAVLMDCQMPELDGYDATGELRRSEPGGVHLPVIAMTANTSRSDREKCLASGMDDYLPKPITPEELDRVLRRWAPRTAEPSDRRLRVEATSADFSTAAVPLEPAGVERLRSEFGSTGGLRRPIVELFGTQARELLSEMRWAIEAGDAGTVSSNAHKLKGGCLELAATHTAEQCRELEIRVGAGSLQGAIALVDEIEGAFEEAYAALCDLASSDGPEQMPRDMASEATTTPQRDESSLPQIADKPMAPLAVAGDHPRLMIADDDAVTLSMLSASLGHDFDVVGLASDGEQAIELASASRPDVALVDVNMPKGGGLGAVHGIRKFAPDTAIVALSAGQPEETIRELIRAGAMTYHRKGIETPALVETLTASIKAHAWSGPIEHGRQDVGSLETR